MSKVGEKIRKMREEAGRSLRELARDSGLHFNTIAKIERGDRNPDEDSDTVKQIVAALSRPPKRPAKREAHKNGRPRVGVADWAPKFLAAVKAGKSVRDAAKLCGVNESLPYRRAQRDQEFALAWDSAKHEAKPT